MREGWVYFTEWSKAGMMDYGEIRSEDLDRYYFEDIQRTYSKLKEILKTWDFESKALYYESSW